ncbi:hypothetical protein A4A49_56683, partial [Nicotiana attenuata]
DHHGIFLHAISSPLGEGTNNQAETQAALIGITWCMDNGYTRIHLEADSNLLIQWITKVSTPPWNICMHIQKLRDLCNMCDSISYSHVYREANYPADSLSKLSHSLSSTTHYHNLQNLPPQIRGQIILDYNGTPAFRHKQTNTVHLPPLMSHLYSYGYG